MLLPKEIKKRPPNTAQNKNDVLNAIELLKNHFVIQAWRVTIRGLYTDGILYLYGFRAQNISLYKSETTMIILQILGTHIKIPAEKEQAFKAAEIPGNVY